MPKLLHLPLNVPGSEQIGQEKGFRDVFSGQGDHGGYVQMDYLNDEARLGRAQTNQRLLDVVAAEKPDIIWAQLQETDTFKPETWAAIKKQHPNVWLTTWSGDARTYVPAGMQRWLPHFDIFYNDTNQVDLYRPYCQRYEFMPIAVDPDEATDWSHPTGDVPEVVFIGNHYGDTFTNGPFRYQVVKALSDHYGSRFGVYGNGWDNTVRWKGTCPVKHQGAYYRKAKVVISVDHIAGILHWSERLVWALASGTPVVAEHQPGIERWFSHNNHLLYFASGSVNNCIEMVQALLDNSEKRSLIGTSAMRCVRDHHTWKQRAEQVLQDYEERNTHA